VVRGLRYVGRFGFGLLEGERERGARMRVCERGS
jgi:hypothetical protein